jgi:hypothetical protein
VRFRGIHAGIANFTRGSGTHSCGCPDGRHGKGPLPTTHCDWPGHYCDWIGTAVPHPLHLFAKGHIKAPWCTLPRASSCTPESAACCAPNDAVWQVSVRAPPVSASPTPPPHCRVPVLRENDGWMDVAVACQGECIDRHSSVELGGEARAGQVRPATAVALGMDPQHRLPGSDD